MRTQELARASKTRFRQMVTVVRSVNGKPLKEVCPGLRNEFRTYEDAFHTISRLCKERVQELKTSRKSVGEASVMGVLS